MGPSLQLPPHCAAPVETAACDRPANVLRKIFLPRSRRARACYPVLQSRPPNRDVRELIRPSCAIHTAGWRDSPPPHVVRQKPVARSIPFVILRGEAHTRGALPLARAQCGISSTRLTSREVSQWKTRPGGSREARGTRARAARKAGLAPRPRAPAVFLAFACVLATGCVASAACADPRSRRLHLGGACSPARAIRRTRASRVALADHERGWEIALRAPERSSPIAARGQRVRGGGRLRWSPLLRTQAQPPGPARPVDKARDPIGSINDIGVGPSLEWAGFPPLERAPPRRYVVEVRSAHRPPGRSVRRAAPGEPPPERRLANTDPIDVSTGSAMRRPRPPAPTSCSRPARWRRRCCSGSSRLRRLQIVGGYSSMTHAPWRAPGTPLLEDVLAGRRAPYARRNTQVFTAGIRADLASLDDAVDPSRGRPWPHRLAARGRAPTRRSRLRPVAARMPCLPAGVRVKRRVLQCAASTPASTARRRQRCPALLPPRDERWGDSLRGYDSERFRDRQAGARPHRIPLDRPQPPERDRDRRDRRGRAAMADVRPERPALFLRRWTANGSDRHVRVCASRSRTAPRECTR